MHRRAQCACLQKYCSFKILPILYLKKSSNTILRGPPGHNGPRPNTPQAFSQKCFIAHRQRWADCEIFQSESTPDPIKLNPIQSWSAKFFKIISPIQSWSANVKSCIYILPHEAENNWSYFAFSQIRLVEVKIVPAVLLNQEAK